MMVVKVMDIKIVIEKAIAYGFQNVEFKTYNKDLMKIMNDDECEIPKNNVGRTCKVMKILIRKLNLIRFSHSRKGKRGII